MPIDSLKKHIPESCTLALEGPANLEPTFEWIRLAQRVPVRIRRKEVPEDLHLVSGATASIAIET